MHGIESLSVSSPAPRTPPDYGTRQIYGPFHRKTKDGKHPHDLFAKMAKNGQLWGRGRIGSGILAVLAFPGPLPGDASGIEFFSFIEPNTPWGSEPTWYSPPHGQAWEHDGWAKIEVVIKRATEDCI